MAKVVGDLPVRAGRPILDPGGAPSEKINGTWLPPYAMARYREAVSRVMADRDLSEAQARRAVIMAGVDAVIATSDASASLRQEVAQ